jgi:hypothetical protein
MKKLVSLRNKRVEEGGNQDLESREAQRPYKKAEREEGTEEKLRV